MNARDLASSVRSARLRAGWSQERLARELGISSATIHKLEAGKVDNPRREVLRGLADKLGISADDLIGSKKSTNRGA